MQCSVFNVIFISSTLPKPCSSETAFLLQLIWRKDTQIKTNFSFILRLYTIFSCKSDAIKERLLERMQVVSWGNPEGAFPGLAHHSLAGKEVWAGYAGACSCGTAERGQWKIRKPLKKIPWHGVREAFLWEAGTGREVCLSALLAQTQAASHEKSRENQDRPLKKFAFSEQDCLIFSRHIFNRRAGKDQESNPFIIFDFLRGIPGPAHRACRPLRDLNADCLASTLRLLLPMSSRHFVTSWQAFRSYASLLQRVSALLSLSLVFRKAGSKGTPDSLHQAFEALYSLFLGNAVYHGQPNFSCLPRSPVWNCLSTRSLKKRRRR